MDDGYVKLFRAIEDSYLWRMPPAHRVVAIQCLVSARWTDGEDFRAGERIPVPRGSFVTTRQELARRCGEGVSETVVKRALSNLEKSGFVTLEATHKWTRISVVNWDTYQGERPVTTQKLDKCDPNATPTRPNLPLLEEGKKGRNIGGAKRATQMPEGWEPNPKHSELAGKLGVSMADEVAQFRDHHSARGSTFKDWDAAFRTWLRNAAKFSKPKKPEPAPYPYAKRLN